MKNLTSKNMCTIIKHKKEGYRGFCSPWSLYISGNGIACGSCNQLCECENKRQYEIELKELEEKWEKENKEVFGSLGGYSQPHWQIEALKKKYNQ